MGNAATPRSGLIDEFLQAMEDQASEPMPVDRPVARQAQQRPDPVQVHPALTDFYIFCDLVTVHGADVRYSPNWNMYALALLCVKDYDEKNLGLSFTRFLERHRDIVDVWRQAAALARSEKGDPLRPGRPLTALPNDKEILLPCVIYLPNRDRYIELSHGEEHIRRWRLGCCTQQFVTGRTGF